MIHITLPPGEPRHRLPFYLAMEEWVANTLPPADYVFSWIVEPTVIFGRNQVIDKEVNMDYCREQGISFYRRKSGGGCVYADLDNIMFSYITPRPDVEGGFEEYTSMMVKMLAAQGVKAEATGRNDIFVDGKKVAGNAFYRLPGRSIVHGTMLYSTNLAHMVNAITPSRSKLESKKVKSVESHIVTLDRYLEIPIETFRSRAMELLADSTLELSPAQVTEIEQIELGYYRPEWIYNGEISGSREAVTKSQGVTRRIEGVGELCVTVATDKATGKIATVMVSGDFFADKDPSATLTEMLAGCDPDRECVEAKLADADISRDIINRLRPEDLADMIVRAIREENN